MAPEYTYRPLTAAEITRLESAGCSSPDWTGVGVAEPFDPAQLVASRFEGCVRIGPGARVLFATVRNYTLGADVVVERVAALECRHRSSFGNGVRVAVMNECGGRTIPVCDRLSAQTAYVMTFYRHRPQTVAALEAMVDARASELSSEQGSVGRGSVIRGTTFVREVLVGEGVTIEGASSLCNGTLCDGARVGADVKAEGFIAAEGALLDNGATVEHCFVGECCRLDKGFTATESLFFANSHCENGEAAAIFAGPCTVSHHKSSLLIAGYFSFFNAGSGSNQSNHLFKSGAVHQALHLRGCKFGSSAYVMAPAREGAFTVVLGRHVSHHDTEEFPYSYLVERDGRSTLMPAANLTSYGAVRDVGKWPARDRRTLRRDVVDYEAWNPYVAGGFVRAVNRLNTLAEERPDAESHTWQRVVIRSTALQRGLGLYNKAIVASLGYMLERCRDNAACDGSGSWFDLAGQYVTRREVEAILAAVDRGEISGLDEVDARFRRFHDRYDDYARSWALHMLGSLLGRTPTAQEIAEAVEAGSNARAALQRMTDADRERDCGPDMSVGYGIDADGDQEVVRRDYAVVRGL